MNLVIVMFFSRQSNKLLASGILTRAAASNYVNWLRQVSFVENIKVVGALDGQPILA